MTRDQMTILFGGTTLINRRASGHLCQNLIRFSFFSVNAGYTPHFHTGLQGRLGFQGHGNLSAYGFLSVMYVSLIILFSADFFMFAGNEPSAVLAWAFGECRLNCRLILRQFLKIVKGDPNVTLECRQSKLL